MAYALHIERLNFAQSLSWSCAKMADLSRIRDPKSLFSLCIDILTENFKILKNEIKCLSGNILFDIYFKVSQLTNFEVVVIKFLARRNV